MGRDILRTTQLVAIGCVLLGFVGASSASARDMHGRFGLGYNNQFSNSTAAVRVPGISMKYSFTRDIAVEAIAAVATSTPTNTAFGVKFFKNVFHETSLTFYFMIGGALVSAANSGADILSGFGAEFFIPGIESLGISVEFGARFTSISGSFVLETLGASFLDAGVHFYF